jgi:hypothetical protein
MTLEINEIHVQISVTPPSPVPYQVAQSMPAPLTTPHSDLLDQLVERCVRHVLHHLRRREHR